MLHTMTVNDVSTYVNWYLVLELGTVLIIPYLTSESRSFRKHFSLTTLCILMTLSVIMLLSVASELMSSEESSSSEQCKLRYAYVLTSVVLVKTPM